MNDKTEQKWHIWSIEHNGWWGPNCHGYVRDINHAGIYQSAEALGICIDANGYLKSNFPPNEAMVPVSDSQK